MRSLELSLKGSEDASASTDNTSMPSTPISHPHSSPITPCRSADSLLLAGSTSGRTADLSHTPAVRCSRRGERATAATQRISHRSAHGTPNSQSDSRTAVLSRQASCLSGTKASPMSQVHNCGSPPPHSQHKQKSNRGGSPEALLQVHIQTRREQLLMMKCAQLERQVLLLQRDQQV